MIILILLQKECIFYGFREEVIDFIYRIFRFSRRLIYTKNYLTVSLSLTIKNCYGHKVYAFIGDL